MRLDAFLSKHAYGSRSEVRAIIRKKRVTVHGEICTKATMNVEDDGSVAVDGAACEVLPDAIHIALHKPLGYSCSNDPDEAPILPELFPPLFTRMGVQWAGRLDRNTSGLLICSTDGQFLHSISNPRRKIGKRYCVGYSGTLPQDAVQQCDEGILLNDDPKPCRPAKLQLLEDGQAEITLFEGRYHQVRRMFAALGCEVVELHRKQIGEYVLPDIEPGKWIDLDESARKAIVSGLPYEPSVSRENE